MQHPSGLPLTRLKNLGPASCAWLAEAGFRTRADLERVGAVMAYKIVKHRQPQASLNLLYALEAALRDVPWHTLSAEEREALRQEAAAPLAVSPGRR